MDEVFDVTLVTFEKFPTLTPDDRILRSRLEERGLSVRVAQWRDPRVDWGASPLTLVRSVWDYFEHTEPFLQWIAEVEHKTVLLNPPALLRWNINKRYLFDLQARGIPIVPTQFVPAGSTFDLGAACVARGWKDVVIKPCIGAASYRASRFIGEAIAGAGQLHLDLAAREYGALVQPFVEAVVNDRERSLVFFGGRFSHGLLRAPFSPGDLLGENLERLYTPSTAEITFAERVIDAIVPVPTYGRVDFVRTERGFALMELELFEPSFYLRFCPTAADAIVDVLVEAIECSVHPIGGMDSPNHAGRAY